MNTLFETHPSPDTDALTLWDMKGAFLVLSIGLLIAIVSYLFEFTYVTLKNILLK